MASFFQNSKKNFKDVDVTDQGVNTEEFLQASAALVEIFGLFGTVFGIVQNDMNGNIEKIRTRYSTNPAVNSTLQNLVKAEVAEKKKTATEGLLWLTRGLDFTLQSLERNLANPTEELSASFTKGYENTLRPHHSMFVRPVFAGAMKACPYRADFYKKLGADQAAVQEDMKQWLQGLRKVVEDIQKFYAAGKYI
ncbi:hypothetical protein DFQ27_008861 [Actinomortierella ambigua]|uniref:Glycolipid transfer protein domain-containing protein n=1 Tax=Actinomortierella ambigua TaxID=1343610 RepID=A0A9P6QF65_9FUNG|nr:hypothetical protein DFQ27_008861 [Actinomortierella ambigua]